MSFSVRKSVCFGCLNVDCASRTYLQNVVLRVECSKSVVSYDVDCVARLILLHVMLQISLWFS